MRHLYLLLLLACFSFGCKKDSLRSIDCIVKTNRLDDVNALIPGTYEWVYTVTGSRAGTTVTTPASTGKNYRYVFNIWGNVDYYENNVLTTSYNYIVARASDLSAISSDPSTLLLFNDKQNGQQKERYKIEICPDSASFTDQTTSIFPTIHFKRN